MKQKNFQIESPVQPEGDQPKAIKQICTNLKKQNKTTNLNGSNRIWKNPYYGSCDCPTE